ncbi:ACT domain-containing protein [Alteromonas flava]|uniref:ACT domain-containing protein n=1 Tax=Alteromonas flava TaxID=2048003 RepID=UPI000C284C3D|nr:ACT domain-containing protein [Alteromonas flava]
MPGETNLQKMLQTIRPTLTHEHYVFVTIENGKYGDYAELEPKAMFMEDEGMTLVISKLQAIRHHLAYASVFRCITLKVHSSLDAVGLTAAIAQQLAKYEISANVIAGYFHDHIFVHANNAEKAQQALLELQG